MSPIVHLIASLNALVGRTSPTRMDAAQADAAHAALVAASREPSFLRTVAN